MPAQDFARDLGYLDGFFTKLEAHAKTLGPAEGAELTRLIAEERERWARIRALVAGGPASKPTAAEPKPDRPASPRAAHALTVGTLIGR